MKAVYIAFEGIDGSGKTKQIDLLHKHLASSGKKVLLTRELGSIHDSACSKLREVYLCSKLQMDDLAAQFLLASCSIQHSEKVIKPNLQSYDYILSDRSVESNLAYGYALGFEKSLINQIFLQDCRRIRPDLIVYLDIDPKIAYARSKKRALEFDQVDRIESKGIEFQKAVREFYLERLVSFPKNSFQVNASQLSIQETHESILRGLKL